MSDLCKICRTSDPVKLPSAPRPHCWKRANFEDLCTRLIAKNAQHSRDRARPLVVDRLRSEIPSLLRGLLADPEWLDDLPAYGLPNGFVAIKILAAKGCNLRLHFFNQQAKVEGLHSHKWPFESAILAGTLVSENWRKAGEGETPQMVTGCFKRSKVPGADTLEARLVSLNRQIGMVFEQEVVQDRGSSYYMDEDTIHRVMRSAEQASTLVLTHPACATAWIYDLAEEHPDAVKAGGEPVKRSSRLVGSTERRRHIQTLLHRLLFKSRAPVQKGLQAIPGKKSRPSQPRPTSTGGQHCLLPPPRRDYLKKVELWRLHGYCP